jgi:tetratricopeptide (TPR) repeat protein
MAGSPTRRAASVEAEDFYLKGRYDWNQRTPASLNQAVDDFTQAIVRDPGYAAAYVGLADCYNLLREFGAMPAKEAYPRALAAAQKAVELDPDSAEAHVSLAFASFWGFIRVADAEREFRRALALDPNSAHAHHWYATYLLEIGRFPEAVVEIERAQKLDPSSTPILADKGLILLMTGQTDQATALLKQIEITAPGFPSAHSYLSELYFVRKEYALYLEEAETLARLQHDNATLIRLAEERRALASGGPEALLETRLQAGKRLYAQGLRDNFALAGDYAAAGVTAQALRYLQRSYQNHELELCTLAVNTQFRSMHEDPTFRGLVAKVGLPPPE